MSTAVTVGLDPGQTRQGYDAVADVYLPVAVAVFVVVVTVLTVVAVRHRSRPGRVGSQRTGAPRVELAYTVLLVVIAAALAWRTLSSTTAADPIEPGATRTVGPAALTIHVVASQWNWRFDYGGGVVQTGDGAGRTAVLVVPEGKVVQLDLTSRDVVHAFWIPVLRAKYDALPGRVNTFDLNFARGLDYTTARCSEYCGTYHDQMRFRVRVLTTAGFDAWLAGRRRTVTA